MKLTFVNHASVIFQHEDIKLITDPWLFGKAFNNGWDLVSESKMRIHDFNSITHIWFSHEHPDHFNLTTLNAIPADMKKHITILFQNTLDHRVAKKCTAMGFKDVIELENGKLYSLAPDFKIKCVPVPFYDSWLWLNINGTKFLNLNDCVVNTTSLVQKVYEITGIIDVLLTQYAYANKVGGKDDLQMRLQESKNVLAGIKIQIDILKPAFVIPFASFVRFTHKDNHYLNEGMVGIDDAFHFIIDETLATPVILYPNDSWNCKSRVNSYSAICDYKADFATPFEPCIDAKPVALSQLKTMCNSYRKKIREKNNMALVRFLHHYNVFHTTKIYLKDLQTAIVFDLVDGIREANFEPKDADIITDSDSLNFVFEFEYGADSLRVNGRYETGNGNVARFFSAFKLGTLNNNGRNVNHLFSRVFKHKMLRCHS